MSPATVEYGTGRAPTARQEAMAASYAALSAQWGSQRMPKERFEITFRSGWGACGEAMTVLDGFGAEDASWEHDAGRHAVRFTCTFSTLKSMQAAMRGVSVADLRCRRLQMPPKGDAS